MISLCPLAPCIKRLRDMLEVHSSQTYEEWAITGISKYNVIAEYVLFLAKARARQKCNCSSE